MDSIVADRKAFQIQQKKEWGEILISFETRNRYAIYAKDGQEIGFAAEESGGFMASIGRNFLGKCRKLSLHIYDADGNEVGRGEKPFRWFFQTMEIFEGDRKIGALERRWSWLNRTFSVYDANGSEVMKIHSPLFKIWTFKLMVGEREVGRISKKFSGALKEMFTDADNFGVEVFEDVPRDVTKLLLAATFLVDLVYFENNN